MKLIVSGFAVLALQLIALGESLYTYNVPGIVLPMIFTAVMMILLIGLLLEEAIAKGMEIEDSFDDSKELHHD